jgi:hypothetical protein
MKKLILALAVAAATTSAMSSNYIRVPAPSLTGATVTHPATPGPVTPPAPQPESPEASASLAGIAFGDVAGGTRVVRQAVLNNTSKVALQISSTYVQGAGFALDSSTCGATLRADASCVLNVALVANEVDAHAGTIRVLTSNGEVTALLTAQSRQARLAVSPLTEQVFGEVQVGMSRMSPTLVNVTNTGNVATAGFKIDVPANYSLASNTCAGEVAVGAQCRFNLQFEPTVAEPFSGQVSVNANGLTAKTFNVTGQGSMPKAELTATLDFGRMTVADTAILEAVVRNAGAGPLTFKVAPGAGSLVGAGFTLANTDCQASLGVNQTCYVKVRFTAPAQAGDLVGTLTLDTSAGVLTTQLKGTSFVGSLTYTLGAAGTGGFGATAGAPGGQTRAVYMNRQVVAGGGAGGNFNSKSSAAGGAKVVGNDGAAGGIGRGASGDAGGGGGGGAGGGAPGVNAGGVGTVGGATVNFGGLQPAVAAANFQFSLPGAGGTAGECRNCADGSDAAGLGGGGGGAGWYGGNGGNGMYGGGGGGASGYSPATNYRGGAGGQGVVVVQFRDGTAIVLTSGTSYEPPKAVSRVWAIGAGGGGAGATTDTTAGGGGGAGAIVYMSH